MTIDELLTIESIKSVRLKFCDTLDSQDLPQLLGVFTDTATIDLGENYGVWEGKAAIERLYREQFPNIGSQFDAIHVVTNPVIVVTGPTTAHGRWYLIDLLTRQKPETGGGLSSPGGHANPLIWLGIYEDQYRKVGDEWKIERMKLHFLWPSRDFKAIESGSQKS